jgi:hypothetical protein
MQQPSNCDKEGRSLAERAMLAIINDFIFRSLAAAACRQILPADGGVNAGSKFQQENVFCKVLAVPRAAPGQSSAMMIAIQQAPNFWPPFLFFPPAPSSASGGCHRLNGRNGFGDPRQNPMPAERPIDRTVVTREKKW